MYIQNIKPPKHHHGKNTVNIKVYQNTKIDAQRHTTDKQIGGGWKYRLGTVSDTCHWGFKSGLGAPNLTLIPSPSFKDIQCK